ncbi:MAG: hypothetical protein CME06_17220 [Gemmatimonadetes bacterium]|nr:hypothetical protein [Gemmatimonadota bacterium]
MNRPGVRYQSYDWRKSLWLGLFIGLANGVLAATAASWTENPLLGSWYFVWEYGLRLAAGPAPEWLYAGLGSLAGAFTLFGVAGLATGALQAILLAPFGRRLGARSRLAGAHFGLAVFLLLFSYGLVGTFDVAFSHAEVTSMARRIIGVIFLVAVLLGWAAGRVAGPAIDRCSRVPGRGIVLVVLAFVVLGPGLAGALQERSRRALDATPNTLSPPGRVILLGIDGLERSLIYELAAEGRLPNFARAIAGGVIGPLRTIIPYYSPVVWTSVATGKRPHKHGVTGFVDAETHDADLLDRRDIGSAALWDIAAARNLRGGFVNWYYTWPAVRPGDGYMVSDRLAYTDLPLNVAPDSLAPIVQHEVSSGWNAYPMDRYVDLEFDEEYKRFPKNTLDYERHHFYMVLERSIARDVASIRSAVAIESASDDSSDLLAVYIRASDAVSHIHWKHHVASSNPGIARRLWGVEREDIESFGEAVRGYYGTVDDLLGEIMDLMDESTTLVIASDHGFGFNLAGGRAVKVDRLLQALGFLHFNEGTEEIDWSRTGFFDNPNNLRIAAKRRVSANLAGREPQGTQSREANRRLVSELQADLKNLRTTNGLAVFTDVRSSELSGGIDLVVQINRHLPLDGSILLPDGRHFPVSEMAVNFRISGMHRMDATLLMCGRGVDGGRKVRGAGVLDIAPTVLHLLGQPIARDMDGRVLTELLADEPAARAPVYLESYDSTRLVEAGGVRSDARVDEVIKEQLRSLGYIQ